MPPAIPVPSITIKSGRLRRISPMSLQNDRIFLTRSNGNIVGLNARSRLRMRDSSLLPCPSVANASTFAVANLIAAAEVESEVAGVAIMLKYETDS